MIQSESTVVSEFGGVFDAESMFRASVDFRSSGALDNIHEKSFYQQLASYLVPTERPYVEDYHLRCTHSTPTIVDRILSPVLIEIQHVFPHRCPRRSFVRRIRVKRWPGTFVW